MKRYIHAGCQCVAACCAIPISGGGGGGEEVQMQQHRLLKIPMKKLFIVKGWKFYGVREIKQLKERL